MNVCRYCFVSQCLFLYFEFLFFFSVPSCVSFLRFYLLLQSIMLVSKYSLEIGFIVSCWRQKLLFADILHFVLNCSLLYDSASNSFCLLQVALNQFSYVPYEWNFKNRFIKRGFLTIKVPSKTGHDVYRGYLSADDGNF